MEKMIAYCGLICTDCDAYIATLNNDDKLRAEVAAKWTKEYNHPFRPEEINCDGCLPQTPKSIGQLNVCAQRKCGADRGVRNCGWCEDYPCSINEEFFKIVPSLRAVLDAEQQRAEK